jgi:hypothetical protein
MVGREIAAAALIAGRHPEAVAACLNAPPWLGLLPGATAGRHWQPLVCYWGPAGDPHRPG